MHLDALAGHRSPLPGPRANHPQHAAFSSMKTMVHTSLDLLVFKTSRATPSAVAIEPCSADLFV
jgi:hypothetical protein